MGSSLYRHSDDQVKVSYTGLVLEGQQVEADTKRPPFSRQHFHPHFLEWTCRNVNSNFTEICSWGSNCSDNSSVPIRRQANIWINYDLANMCHSASMIYCNPSNTGNVCKEEPNFIITVSAKTKKYPILETSYFSNMIFTFYFFLLQVQNTQCQEIR